MEEIRRTAWRLSLLLLAAGLIVAAVVYWLTGVVFLVLIFAPPVVGYLLQRWRRRSTVDGYPFGLG